MIVANAAIVPAGTPSGGISVFNFGPTTTDVVIDMNGFFAAPTDLNGNTAIGVNSLAANTTGTGNYGYRRNESPFFTRQVYQRHGCAGAHPGVADQFL
jgi:hypothetical protein